MKLELPVIDLGAKTLKTVRVFLVFAGFYVVASGALDTVTIPI